MIFNRLKQEWIKRKESEWKEEISKSVSDWARHLSEIQEGGLKKENDLRATLDKNQADLEDMARRLQDRKEDLAKANEELKAQIRLIEAKASPDSVWVQAFSQGFSKAWDMMIPIMSSGFDKIVDKTRTEAIDSVVSNLDTVVRSRIEQAGDLHLQEPHLLLAKKRDLERKLLEAKDENRKIQCRAYLEALGWVMNGHTVSES